MNKEKEESYLIKRKDGTPKYLVVFVGYWKLLQGIETILFILSLVIVPYESPEYWKLWIAHILISLHIFCKRYQISLKKLSLQVRDSIKRWWKYVSK
jgi:hypothetical protein